MIKLDIQYNNYNSKIIAKRMRKLIYYKQILFKKYKDN